MKISNNNRVNTVISSMSPFMQEIQQHLHNYTRLHDIAVHHHHLLTHHVSMHSELVIHTFMTVAEWCIYTNTLRSSTYSTS